MSDFHKDPLNKEVIEAIKKNEEMHKKNEQKDKRRAYDREYKKKTRASQKAPGHTKLIIEKGTFELAFD
jgi:hypothetical protein